MFRYLWEYFFPQPKPEPRPLEKLSPLDYWKKNNIADAAYWSRLVGDAPVWELPEKLEGQPYQQKEIR